MTAAPMPKYVPQPGDMRYGKSQITNHRDLLPNLDGRSSSARRFRDLVGAFIANSAGIEHVSEIRLNLIRRLAATIVAAETMEAKLIDGENVDIGTLCQLASTTVRISTRLGLDRKMREVGQSLSDILNEPSP